MRRLWKLCGTWLTQIKSDVADPKGWELIAKLVVFLVGFFGLLLTYLTLVLNLQMEEIKRNEESYQRFLNDLGSPQERVRVAAISRIPELMARRGQSNPSINPFAILWRSLGFGQIQVHARSVRNQVKQLLLSGPIEGSPLTRNESQALLDSLSRIPIAIWFERSDLPKDSSGGLRWLWSMPATMASDGLTVFTRQLLENARLKGIVIVGQDLTEAELRGLICQDCRFERVNLSRAQLQGARLENSYFDYTNLDGAKLIDARLKNVSFYGTSLRSVNFRKSQIEGSQFYQPELGPIPAQAAGFTDFRGARVDTTTFTECLSGGDASFMLAEFSNSRFYRCNLDRSSFASAVLDGIVFDGSILSNADLSGIQAKKASFVNVTFTNAVLRRANLLDSNLEGSKELLDAAGENRRRETSLRLLNLNIGKVQGVDKALRSDLIQSGAVELACDAAWSNYKQAGYPYEQWLTYRTCAAQ